MIQNTFKDHIDHYIDLKCIALSDNRMDIEPKSSSLSKYLYYHHRDILETQTAYQFVENFSSKEGES